MTESYPRLCPSDHVLPATGGACIQCKRDAQAETNMLIRMAAVKLGLTVKQYTDTFGHRKADAIRILEINPEGE